MLCTECKKEQEKRIPNEEKENAQPANAPASRNGSSPEQQAEPRSWLRQ